MKPRLPIPVLMLALTTVLMLFSVLLERVPGTVSAALVSPQVQASEVQPAALTYFRVMNWLARFLPRDGTRAAAAEGSAPSTCLVRTPEKRRAPFFRLESTHRRPAPFFPVSSALPQVPTL